MLWPLGPHALCELILMCVICVMKKDPNSCLSAFYSLLQSLMEVSKYALNFCIISVSFSGLLLT